MATYLLLKERARAFREDPEVRRAVAVCQVDGLAVHTLFAGENARSLLIEPGAYHHHDFVAAGSGGYEFAHLGQLAIAHLLGAR
jgi:xylose isomerase